MECSLPILFVSMGLLLCSLVTSRRVLIFWTRGPGFDSRLCHGIFSNGVLLHGTYGLGVRVLTSLFCPLLSAFCWRQVRGDPSIVWFYMWPHKNVKTPDTRIAGYKGAGVKEYEKEANNRVYANHITPSYLS